MDYTLATLCGFSFLAGFVDSVVGGGGLIHVPAFFVLYPELTVPQVIGTNRFASAFGTSMAAWNYSRKVEVPWRAVMWAGIAAAICSFLGALVMTYITSDILKPVMLVVMIGIAWFTYSQKQFGQEEQLKVSAERLPLYMAGIGGALGFYNGLIGPGTGSLLVFSIVSLIGYNFLRASAATKVINAICDYSSLAVFLFNAKVIFSIAVPLVFFNTAGGYVGSRMAMLRGNEFIRRLFIGVVSLLIMRFAYDLFWK
jgi:uncharacterized protein